MSTMVGAVAPRIRVLVVDDQQLLREGIASLLRTDPRIDVVGQGSTGSDAVALTSARRPEVVLVDIRARMQDGIQAIREIKQRWPEVRVVILTTHIYDGYVVDGLVAGADGYLLKDASPAALLSGIAAVAAGDHVMEPAVARRVAALLAKQQSDRKHFYDGLTMREPQNLTLCARGFIAKEIAHELRISQKTVRNHVSNMYRKLGIFDRSQAILYALKKGIAMAE